MIAFLKSILRLASPYRLRLGLGIFFGIIGGIVEPLMILTVMFVYSVIFGDAAAPEAQVWWKKSPAWLRDSLMNAVQPAPGSGQPQSYWFVGLIPAVFVLRGIVSYLNVYLLQWVAIRSVTDLRVRVFRHLLDLPASFFANARSADLMSRVLTDTEAMRNIISQSLTTLVKDPVTLITVIAVLFWQQPKMTAMAMVVLPICIVPIASYSRKGRRASAAIQQGFSDLYNRMLESFTGHRILKAYNLEKAVAHDFEKTAGNFTSNYMRMVRSTEIPGPLLETAGSVGVALLLIYVLRQPEGQKPDGSAFWTLILSIITMYRPMKSLVRLHALLEQARVGYDRVFEMLNTRSSLVEPASPKPLEAAGRDIHFENVSFAYKEKMTLRNINLRVKAGSLVALVGASGSGKTTLTNLLLRFYDPVEGRIRIGDIDIREVSTRDLRDQMAVVTQETVLFNESIRHNIALGKPGASEEEVIAAAKHAHAHTFISEKPQGYDTVIGERGVALSGGQRQRLAIARAILKNAPILILDEATSALDTESERSVQAALEELMVGRTTICIAHRLSTIQKADTIVVMQEGAIVETGTHAELLARRAVYFNLHQLQFNT